MTRITQLKNGKLEASGQEMGAPSTADIERRAKEIALIDGRTDVSRADRERAQAELRDKNLPPTLAEDADSMQSLSRDPSDPAVDRGRQAPEYVETDEEEALERSALEGVEEAQHDQMVQSRNDIDEPLRSRPKKRP